MVSKWVMMTHGFENHKSKQNSKLDHAFEVFHRNMWVEERKHVVKGIKHLYGISSVWSSFFRSFIAKKPALYPRSEGRISGSTRSKVWDIFTLVQARPLIKEAAGFWASPAGMLARGDFAPSRARVLFMVNSAGEVPSPSLGVSLSFYHHKV